MLAETEKLNAEKTFLDPVMMQFNDILGEKQPCNYKDQTFDSSTGSNRASNRESNRASNRVSNRVSNNQEMTNFFMAGGLGTSSENIFNQNSN